MAICAIAERASPGHQGGSLHLAHLCVIVNGLDALFVHEGTHINLRVEAIADVEFFGGGSQSIGERLLHCFVDYHTAGRGTTLAGRAECSPGNVLDGQVQVGILQHDHGIFAAQFKCAAAQVASANLGDMPSNLG